MLYIVVSVMGFSTEFFYKSEYRRIYAIIEARNEYQKKTGTPANPDNEVKAYEQLDKFLG